jgi:hypothetical protein
VTESSETVTSSESATFPTSTESSSPSTESVTESSETVSSSESTTLPTSTESSSTFSLLTSGSTPPNCSSINGFSDFYGSHDSDSVFFSQSFKNVRYFDVWTFSSNSSNFGIIGLKFFYFNDSYSQFGYNFNLCENGYSCHSQQPYRIHLVDYVIDGFSVGFDSYIVTLELSLMEKNSFISSWTEKIGSDAAINFTYINASLEKSNFFEVSSIEGYFKANENITFISELRFGYVFSNCSIAENKLFCPDGWVLHLEFCYFIYKTLMSQPQALSYCPSQQPTSFLSFLSSIEEYIWMKSFIWPNSDSGVWVISFDLLFLVLFYYFFIVRSI